MRIDDVKRTGYERLTQVKRPANGTTETTTSSSVADASTESQTRADRIEQLKQMFAAGRPIDVEQLANKLVESGVVSQRKA